MFLGAAIAQWIRLRLPSCHPGFESQVHHFHFFYLEFLCRNCHVKRTKNKQKEAGFGPFFKKQKCLIAQVAGVGISIHYGCSVCLCLFYHFSLFRHPTSQSSFFVHFSLFLSVRTCRLSFSISFFSLFLYGIVFHISSLYLGIRVVSLSLIILSIYPYLVNFFLFFSLSICRSTVFRSFFHFVSLSVVCIVCDFPFSLSLYLCYFLSFFSLSI